MGEHGSNVINLRILMEQAPLLGSGRKLRLLLAYATEEVAPKASEGLVLNGEIVLYFSL